MDYLKEFAIDCDIRGFHKHTTTTYASHLKDFLEIIDDPISIDQSELRAHLAALQKRNYKASTYNSYYAALNTFYDFLIFEKLIRKNPIPEFRKRYLSHVMKISQGEKRQIISVQDMKDLLHQANDLQERALITTLAKTGLRRGELLDLQAKDIDLDKQEIRLKDKAKRSRTVVFMDEELSKIMEEHLSWRECNAQSHWLWISSRGGRIHKDDPGRIIAKNALALGLHQHGGPLEQRLTCHCFRHFFTTELFRAGMDPQYIKWLRGDSLQKEAWQIYNHIDPEHVREEYEKCIPKLFL
ncbi:tyrosine-type recombinase/integrase [Methanococcoides methylutens]|uniref:tyrosine-type recombinase/integrase n=1 Tax=Methanococcoides methylutens TaxID=2226 RepID=UPI000694C388|nr:tyrosine-type recombinase/integrase [Methanococcoides methylutens]